MITLRIEVKLIPTLLMNNSILYLRIHILKYIYIFFLLSKKNQS